MTQQERQFKVILLEEAESFLSSLPVKAASKITYNLRKAGSGFWNAELFKKLEGTDIWEFRTLYEGTAYRLFAFWDTEAETLVVATHGILKKTQKTPAREITKAESIRDRYFERKTKKRSKQ